MKKEKKIPYGKIIGFIIFYSAIIFMILLFYYKFIVYKDAYDMGNRRPYIEMLGEEGMIVNGWAMIIIFIILGIGVPILCYGNPKTYLKRKKKFKDLMNEFNILKEKKNLMGSATIKNDSESILKEEFYKNSIFIDFKYPSSEILKIFINYHNLKRGPLIGCATCQMIIAISLFLSVPFVSEPLKWLIGYIIIDAFFVIWSLQQWSKVRFKSYELTFEKNKDLIIEEKKKNRVKSYQKIELTQINKIDCVLYSSAGSNKYKIFLKFTPKNKLFIFYTPKGGEAFHCCEKISNFLGIEWQYRFYGHKKLQNKEYMKLF